MSYAQLEASNPYAVFGTSVAEAPAAERANFIRKTYTHLAAAIYTFVAIEYLIFSAFDLDVIVPKLFGTPFSMLAIFGGFIFVSWIAHRWAHSETSPAMQYMGLGLYVLFDAIFFVPLLWIAQDYAVSVEVLGKPTEVGVIGAAGVTTLVMFGALTAFAWMSRADFSFLRTGLFLVGVGAFALILMSFLMGWQLGAWFSALMIVFACGYILYDTSNIIHHYRSGQHVAASLALFASVALLFWYVLRIFIQLSSSRD